MTPVTLRTRLGVLDTEDGAAFDAFAERVREGAPRIFLHLHGGLVSEADAAAIAARLSAPGEQSYNAPEGWEQLFIIWRTGAWETLEARWRALAQDDVLYRTLLRRLLHHLSGLVAGSNSGGRSAGAATRLTPDQIERELSREDDLPFAAYDDSLAATGQGGGGADLASIEEDLATELDQDPELDVVARDIEAAVARSVPVAARAGVTGDGTSGEAMLERLDPEVVKELGAEAAATAATRGAISGAIIKKVISLAVRIGTAVIRRYRAGRDHGLHATIAEEIVRALYADRIGALIWSLMKDNAADHFSEAGLGSRLLEVVSANPAARVVIVGHSAGSIFASDLLLHAKEKGLAFRTDLIFLAPAVRVRKFADVLDRAEDSIGRFRLFAMSDALERRDALLGPGTRFIYPSSLLYLVSGLFEGGVVDAPILGMQRFLGNTSSWDTDASEASGLARVRAYLAGGDARTIFSASVGADGQRSAATSHGGFDDDVETLASVATFLI